MKCLGRNSSDHCCWIKGKICPFLEENTQPGYRWTCGLRRELGDWDLVLQDPRYVEEVQPFWNWWKERTGLESSCRDWPGDQFCSECGVNQPEGWTKEDENG